MSQPQEVLVRGDGVWFGRLARERALCRFHPFWATYIIGNSGGGELNLGEQKGNRVSSPTRTS